MHGRGSLLVKTIVVAVEANYGCFGANEFLEGIKQRDAKHLREMSEQAMSSRFWNISMLGLNIILLFLLWSGVTISGSTPRRGVACSAQVPTRSTSATRLGWTRRLADADHRVWRLRRIWPLHKAMASSGARPCRWIGSERGDLRHAPMLPRYTQSPC
jgi:hypothetical protein